MIIIELFAVNHFGLSNDPQTVPHSMYVQVLHNYFVTAIRQYSLLTVKQNVKSIPRFNRAVYLFLVHYCVIGN
jgi:hypothetical protein